MTNVIQFPKKNAHAKDKDEVSLQEEIDLRMNTVKYGHINQTLETIIPMLFNNIDLAGFQIVPEYPEDDDPYIRDNALIVESIRSLLCKCYGLTHPFQDLAEKLFEPNEDGSFTLTKNLNMDFSGFDEAQTES
jgi:hypothetical protein